MKGEDFGTGGWAVVTGASSGIGQRFAQTLARRGYQVLAVARRKERLEALAKESAPGAGRIEPFVADLADEAAVAAVAERAAAAGDIEILVNCAGVATAGDFAASSLAAELGSVRLNVEAVVHLTQRLLPAMVRRGRGRILNVASVVGFQPFPHFAVYAATKAFVLSFTESIAAELEGTGVTALALCPGAIQTEMDVFSKNPGLLGKLPSLRPDAVVRAGLAALERGRVVKVVGLMNRLLVLSTRLLPRFVVRWLMKVVAKAPPAPA
jgi:short-subunit dehydrogenase